MTVQCDKDSPLYLSAQRARLRPRDPDAQLLLGNALMDAARPGDAIAAYDAALRLRPDYAAALYNLGNALLASGDPARAEAHYRAASALAPEHSGAHNNRGGALRALGRLEEAAEAYRTALGLCPSMFWTQMNLGTILLALNRPEQALACFSAAIRLQPGDAEGCNNMGGALLALDQPEAALCWFDGAIEAEPEHVQARLGRSMALLGLGRLREGFAAYECRWRDPRFLEGERAYAAPVWTGESDVSGRTILLHAEQGLGDTIMFARYAPLLRARGARVVLEVQPPLVRALSRLADVVIAARDPLPAHDLHVSLASLPCAFGTDLATLPGAVPYLRAEPRVEVRGPGLNVGVAFSGCADHPEDALRSIPAALLIPLFGVADVTFHIVQKDVRSADAQALRDLPRVVCHDGGPGDVAATARLLAAMDLVISVDTSIAHLAGAMAVEAWIMLQASPDFRWMRASATTPWYATARLFRQGPDRTWEPVIAAVTHALEQVSHRAPGSDPTGIDHENLVRRHAAVVRREP